MTQLISMAIWPIIFIVGLPQLSETVYTPALPDIARALHTSESMVEYTLTIYLFAFALGTLFWGTLSDRLGRRPCLLAGLVLFIIGSLGCFFSSSIEMLLVSRFVQALGGSIGSVLGQAICRDAFSGAALGKVYSSVGSALALFPALGPLVGGVMAQWFGWRIIFIFLSLFALFLMGVIAVKVPETHLKKGTLRSPFFEVLTSLLKDKKVWGFTFLVGGHNGIIFSYFAEGPFYLMNGLGLTPSQYGTTFILISLATMLGSLFSKRLQSTMPLLDIIKKGLFLMLAVVWIFSTVAIIHTQFFTLERSLMIAITLLSQMGLCFGGCMVTNNALALALVDYKKAIGTASSLFGLAYYIVISLLTLGIGTLHQHNLLLMPLYFLGIVLLMLLSSSYLLFNKKISA